MRNHALRYCGATKIAGRAADVLRSLRLSGSRSFLRCGKRFESGAFLSAGGALRARVPRLREERLRDGRINVVESRSQPRFYSRECFPTHRLTPLVSKEIE